MGTRILLVEGDDDRHVIWALLMAHNVPNTFKVELAGGVTELLESVPVRLKASDLERFAVVLDADEDIQNRWDALRNRLVSSGYTDLPVFPAMHGTVVQREGGPRIGIWIMPDNQVPGMLENFLSFLVPAGDMLLPLVDGFLNSIPPESRRCPPQRVPKARIHIWLALQNEPGKPLGQSITAKYLDAHHERVEPFLTWIKTVFID